MTTTLATWDDIAWLQEFYAKLCSRDGNSWRGRTISREELERVFEIIRKHELICEMSCNGFGPMMWVYGHPVTPGLGIETLFSLTHTTLPVNVEGDVRGEKAWRNSWETLSPFTHNERNRQLLALYGRAEPQEYEHYIY